MPKRGIVMGQRIQQEKLHKARDLRRDMTPQERALWRCLRANRLNGFHFRRQQIIDGFIVDFYCDAADLVIELDGGIHHSQMEYDRERDAVLRVRGLRVIRIPNDEVDKQLPAVLARIAEACATREGT